MKISQLIVKSHRLKSVDFRLNPEFRSVGNIELKIDAGKTVTKHNDKPLAEVSLTVSIFKDKTDAPFWCTIIYQGLFSWNEGVASQKVDEYLKCNAPALLYSYIRPIVTQLTVSADLPALTLPFMNFMDS